MNVKTNSNKFKIFVRRCCKLNILTLSEQLTKLSNQVIKKFTVKSLKVTTSELSYFNN